MSQYQQITRASDDGLIVYTLTPIDGSVHVERSQRFVKARYRLCMKFEEENTFVQWCRADSVRFVYPLLSADIERQGRALFAAR